MSAPSASGLAGSLGLAGGAWLSALALDLLAGEPPRAVHPVAIAGRAIEALRDRAPRDRALRDRALDDRALDDRAPRAPRAQLVHGAWIVVLPALGAVGLGRLVAGLRPWPLRLVASIWLLKTTFALRELLAAGSSVERSLSAGRSVERSLAGGDLAAAREGLRALVSRPVEGLDEPHVASAAVESLAENLSDSYLAPLFYYVVGGLPAALAYRVVNTADAMVGYRGDLEYLGKVSARLDDLLNLIPARLSALALAAAAPLVGLPGDRSLAVARREHGRTASPNAGWPMAAAAGALGVWLEKPGHYRLDGARAPGRADVAQASRLVQVAALLGTAALLAARGAHRASARGARGSLPRGSHRA